MLLLKPAEHGSANGDAMEIDTEALALPYSYTAYSLLQATLEPVMALDIEDQSKEDATEDV